MPEDEGPRQAWELISQWWDEQSGEGDPFHTHLIHPFIDRCLPLQPGDTLLDLACGNGSVARRFARRGVLVTAVDFSRGFIDIARAKSHGIAGITFEQLDLTSPEELQRLPATAFKAALCSMALHDMPDIDPLLSALPRVLEPGGRFVCSIVHPYFNSTPRMSLVSEDDFSQPTIVTTHSLRVFDYLTPASFLFRGKQEQPVPHPNYHRPLQAILASCFSVGLLMDGYFEPSAALMPDDVESTWKKIPTIPPVLILSFRLRS
jgi:2-polyprenyl-3-methyl-5-hydroxy-6-metoxy-1,4-benzoquinol methylase